MAEGTMKDDSSSRTAFTEIPGIDIGGLFDPSLAVRTAVAREIARACADVGFLYVYNHGVPTRLGDDLLAAALAFFALPEETKRAWYIGKSTNHRGYVPVGEEGFAYGTAAPEAKDRKEAFDTALDLPADDPDYVAGNPMLGPNVWPAEVPELRAAATAYYEAVMALGRRMLHAFALGLGLDESFFDRFVRKPTSQLRLVHYPPAAPGEAAMGIGAHTDYECFTILKVTEPGLQVLNPAGDWIDAEVQPDAFVINIGDMLEAWTNGRYVATTHRVLRNERERFSFPLFFGVDWATRVAPLAELLQPGETPRYPELVAGEHLFAQTARTFAYLRRRVEAGELTVGDPVDFGRGR
jgi:isopenicillin N synthase-like dioxygenase